MHSIYNLTDSEDQRLVYKTTFRNNLKVLDILITYKFYLTSPQMLTFIDKLRQISLSNVVL